MKTYRIREGFSFIGDKGQVIPAGELIELSDDVAVLHLHRLEAVPEAPKSAKPNRQAKAKADDPAAADLAGTDQSHDAATGPDGAANGQPV